ncbi:low molecular weight phosphotyrosine protein phosphatase [Mucilaginibacter sp. RS28]|uniref:protein-tyrosine-phosphatase n=1 Tax=Mucilaginibacter straminoryzae TaxID=2932774 RepID=A0A9X1X1F9_9SPHI|nr:low molecular weight protein-tyrosine-phosphatase [Mucilaginibacter straminoryzae]MCJ8208255.1 low molecular weight phosphotyrosine protein phosphatase [Mucilaginibacter straminoryzae]
MKILMVCLGNICRSPLAEGIMQHLADEQGLDWQVDSAGTGNWHVGEGPDRRSVRTARQHGIDISRQVCRQFKVSDFDRFDHIFVMDKYNLRDVTALAPDGQAEAKVKLLLVDKEVPDPYYDDKQFEPVFRLIEQSCKDIIKDLTGKPYASE